MSYVQINFIDKTIICYQLCIICILINLFFSFEFVYIYLHDNYCLKDYFIICYIFYYNELKFIYLNDLILDVVNLNNTQHQILLQKVNDMWYDFFKLQDSYVIMVNSNVQRANENSLLRKSYLGSNNSSTKHQFNPFESEKLNPLPQKAFFSKKLLQSNTLRSQAQLL